MRKIGIVSILLVSFLLLISSNVSANSGKQLIIINKATNELAFFDSGTLVNVFDVATGRTDTLTPEGTFKIVNKIKDRPYFKENIPGGDPRNPLGDRWLGLDARGTYGTTYAIHGNNNPNSIGTYVSAGCVRMHNDEVRWLFDQVELFTTVIITNSTASFEEIAKSQNYPLEIQTINQKLTLLENTPIYNNPYPNSTKVNTLQPQVVTATKKMGNWYLINTWIGPKWINPTNVVIGEVKKVNKKIILTHQTSLYDLPSEQTRRANSLQPQAVTAIAEWNGWYQIETWIGPKWIKPTRAIDGVKSISERVTLTKQTHLYNLPVETTKRADSLLPQTVTAFEEWNGWYHIQTWIGSKWIKPTDAMVGVKSISESVEITGLVYLYDLPFDHARTNSVLAPQTVTADQEWNGWYRIETWLGPKWVKPVK